MSKRAAADSLTTPDRRVRRIRTALGVAFLVLLALLGWWVYRAFIDDWKLRQAEAEADRLDPGWRFEDLEGARAAVPDAENGAVQVLAVVEILRAVVLPPPPAQGPSLDQVVAELSPEVRLNAEMLRQVQANVNPAAEAFAAARRLADFPRGRYRIAYSRDLVGTPMPHLQELRKIAALLGLDAALRAEQGDVSGALHSAQAALNVGRSVGDEPIVVSQLVRLACQNVAVHGAERALAQGEPPDAALNSLQHLLEDEAKQPLFLRAARGERAILHRALEVVREGQFDRRLYGFANPHGVPDLAINMLDAYRTRLCHADYLHYLNEYVEIAKLPATQRGPRLEQLKEPAASKPWVLYLFDGKDQPRIACLFRRNEALIRCALVALAVERYRRDKQRWPDGLASLVPRYLREVPADPFDGAPLRYRKLADGVVIYTLGPDGMDDGGRLERAGSGGTVPRDTDVGFRLWDVAQRRQPARTPAPDSSKQNASGQ
jgi:hypothetical protein